MLIIKYVVVNGTEYPVSISDDSMALQAAYAAGGAIIGIWDGRTGGPQADFSSCLYLVNTPEDADLEMLERVVRRRLGLAWRIGETKRLIIREFAISDPLEPKEWALEESMAGGENVRFIFSEARSRAAYIENQYRFHECGLWALEEKESGVLIGKAGITDGELGYHIYPPYRRRGYALEACTEIIRYGKEELLLMQVMLRVEKDNKPSKDLAFRLGFDFPIEEENVLIFSKKL